MMSAVFFQPDYDDIEEENRLKPFPSSRGRDKAKDNKKYGEYLFFCASIRDRTDDNTKPFEVPAIKN